MKRLTFYFFLCIMLTGCKTIEESSILEIHDTIYVHKTDTVRKTIVRHVNDTVRQVVEKTYIINENGDTIKQNVVNNYYQKIVERDSTDYYRSRLDSLLSIMSRENSHEKVVEKQPTFWDKAKDMASHIGFLCILMLSVWILISITKNNFNK